MGIFSWLFRKSDPNQTGTLTQPIAEAKSSQQPEGIRYDVPPKPETSEKKFRITRDSIQTEAIMRLAKENPDWKMTKAQMLKNGIDRIDQYLFDIRKTELIPVAAAEDSPAAVRVIMDGEYIGQIKDGNVTQVFNMMRRGQILTVTGHIRGGSSKFLMDCSGYGEEPSKKLSDYELEVDNDNTFSAHITILKKN